MKIINIILFLALFARKYLSAKFWSFKNSKFNDHFEMEIHIWRFWSVLTINWRKQSSLLETFEILEKFRYFLGNVSRIAQLSDKELSVSSLFLNIFHSNFEKECTITLSFIFAITCPNLSDFKILEFLSSFLAFASRMYFYHY